MLQFVKHHQVEEVKGRSPEDSEKAFKKSPCYIVPKTQAMSIFIYEIKGCSVILNIVNPTSIGLLGTKLAF